MRFNPALPHGFKPLEYSLIADQWEWGGDLIDEPELADQAAKILMDLVQRATPLMQVQPVGFRLTPFGLEIAAVGQDRVKNLRVSDTAFPVHLVPPSQLIHWKRPPTAIPVPVGVPAIPEPVIEPGPPAVVSKTKARPAAQGDGNGIEEFRLALERALPVASKDDSRVAIQHILIDGQRSAIVGTDGHRLVSTQLSAAAMNRVRVLNKDTGNFLAKREKFLLLDPKHAKMMIGRMKRAKDFTLDARIVETEGRYGKKKCRRRYVRDRRRNDREPVRFRRGISPLSKCHSGQKQGEFHSDGEPRKRGVHNGWTRRGNHAVRQGYDRPL